MQLTDEMKDIETKSFIKEAKEYKAIGVATSSLEGLSKTIPDTKEEHAEIVETQPVEEKIQAPQVTAAIQSPVSTEAVLNQEPSIQNEELEDISSKNVAPAQESSILTGNPLPGLDTSGIDSIISSNKEEKEEPKEVQPVIPEEPKTIEMPQVSADILASEPEKTNEELFKVSEQPTIEEPALNKENETQTEEELALEKLENDVNLENPFTQPNVDPSIKLDDFKTEVIETETKPDLGVPNLDGFDNNVIENLSDDNQKELTSEPEIQVEGITPFVDPKEHTEEKMEEEHEKVFVDEKTLEEEEKDNQEVIETSPIVSTESVKQDEEKIDYNYQFEQFREELNALLDEEKNKINELFNKYTIVIAGDKNTSLETEEKLDTSFPELNEKDLEDPSLKGFEIPNPNQNNDKKVAESSEIEGIEKLVIGNNNEQNIKDESNDEVIKPSQEISPSKFL